MKISNTYPEGATKLYHMHGGAVFKVCKNDTSAPDDTIYMMLKPMQHEARATHCLCADITTGQMYRLSVCARGLRYRDASVTLGSLSE